MAVRLIEMLNHMVKGLLPKTLAGGAVQWQQLSVEDAGAHWQGTVQSGEWQGTVVLRLEVEDEGEGHFRLKLVPEELPSQMPAVAEALREVLLKARVTVELDFS